MISLDMATDSHTELSHGDPRQASTASPELTGGAGFTYEDSVAGVYAAALLSETTAPGLPGRQVRRLSVQQGSLGHPLDDLIVEGVGADGVCMRLSLQVKRKLVISAAESNTDFRDTVLRAHATVAESAFTKGLDRVGAVTGEIAEGSKRDFETLCEWARSDHDATAFVKKVNTDGVGGGKQIHFDVVRTILSETVPQHELDVATHRLLSHFVLTRFEMLNEGSVLEAQTVAALSNHLHPSIRTRADDLWRRLLALVRVSQGHAAAFDRKTLVARLNGTFRLNGAPSMVAALAQIMAEAHHAIAEIGNDIAGANIPRDRFVKAVGQALTQCRFVQIGGLPGTGKSVVLRRLVEDELARGPALLLKADRLAGATWAQYAVETGFGAVPVEDLLVDLAAVGSPTLFIDGIDRVEIRHRGVLLDVLNTILESPLLENWRVVATIRDTGIEPLRTWLPHRLLDNGTLVIDVTPFDDHEAKLLATAKPSLATLLFGSADIRAVVRRPFFAAVLMRGHVHDASVPSSEIELATAWWAGGGYGAEAARAGQRRSALVSLARAGAATLGRRIPALDLDPDALAELEADGIVRQVRIGQTVRFVHDIYFEWSFLQLLVSQGHRWPDFIRQIGEPPVLGRVVELHSQGELKLDQDWRTHTELLEQARDLRPQWLRSWMLGPLGLPSFEAHEATYNSSMLADGAKRVAKLAVWYQAEKTRPNPLALDRKIFPDLELADRVRIADSLAWPSDPEAWARCCSWLHRWIAEIPVPARPDVFAVFEVWQNAFADLPNVISETIVELTTSWLLGLEEHLHGRPPSKPATGWAELKHGEAAELGVRLRAVLLRAARAYPTVARNYLALVRGREHIPPATSEQLLTYAPILSEVCPIHLVDFVLRILIGPLPAETVRRASRSSFGGGIHSHDWQSLSIEDRYSFFPSAPTREPFPSLFARAPSEARRLVRALANHAITSWRELHRYDYDHRGTPIPLTLSFPWGQQTFWGDAKEYAWSRGTWGSHAVGCGLMALEAWALKEVEQKRPVDEVLRDILEGHESVSALGVAVGVVLETRHCSVTTLPLLTSQRLWAWDIERYISDSSGGSTPIGFRPQDRPHCDAVVDNSKRRKGQGDLRSVASLCVLRGGDLGAKASEAITRFPDDLPFDYSEEREDAEAVEHLRRTAEIWAEVGRTENYRATPAEDGSGVIVQLNNPKARGADIDTINQRHEEMTEHLKLLNWVHECFKKATLSDRLPLKQAIERARRLDAGALFNAPHGFGPDHYRQSAVAGVAAVALRFAEDLEPLNYEWAADACFRARMTPEAPDNLHFRGTALIDHPVLFAAHGLAALVRHDAAWRKALSALLQLAAHPYEQIVIEVLGGMLDAWDKRPEIAWLALGLAARLSVLERPECGEELPRDFEGRQRHHIEAVVGGALHQSKELEEPPKPLKGMPPAWVPASGGRRFVKGRRGREVPVQWEHSATAFDYQLIGKVLARVPVRVALADERRRDLFLSWCDGLVGWTVERLCPTWSRQSDEKPVDVASSELYAWRRELYCFLARVSLYLPPEDSVRRYIRPIEEADDDTFGSMVECYLSFLACNIMDEPILPATPLALLGSTVPRLLSHHGWRRAAWDDGALHNSELSCIVRILFFINIDGALKSTRFANGDWRDVSHIFPVIEPVLAAQGPTPAVTSAFLTLCERAFDYFPVDPFVTHLSMLLSGGGGTPLGWRGTSLPARLAGLIQRFSERTQPLPAAVAGSLLRALDALVDMGDRRAAAIQTSEVFKNVRTDGSRCSLPRT